MRNSNLFRKFSVSLGIIMLSQLTLPLCFSRTVSANNAVYEGAYNIHEMIAYAEKYAGEQGVFNPVYEIKYAVENGYAVEEDCTNFVSQCLVAGGIPTSDGWNGDSSHWPIFDVTYEDRDGNEHVLHRGYSDGYNTFVNAGLFNEYFSEQGYLVEKSAEGFSEGLILNQICPAVGDIVQFDWEGDGVIEHSVVCCGYENGKLCFAGHTYSCFMKPFEELQSSRPLTYVPAEDKMSGTVVYLIRMTDTVGLTDVTSRYIGKTVAIKSVETEQYVSSSTDQDIDGVDALVNRDVAAGWELFKVEPGDYGEAGFRSLANGNYLTVRVDINSTAAPVRACYGQNYEKPGAWESFRIYEKDGIQYIQSQANGKWLQVSVEESEHPLKACARAASSWERFALEEIPDVNNDDMSSGQGNVSAGTGVPALTTSQAETVEGQPYFGSAYNEGRYTGEMRDGKPNGHGTLEYIDYNGDNVFYTFDIGGRSYKALYYTGGFSDGYRYGQGLVVYEEGWKMEGTFYGAWEAGKKVFEGRVWHKDGGWYLDGYLTATSTSTGDWTWDIPEWQRAE